MFCSPEKKLIFIDIETLGLDPETKQITCIGCLYNSGVFISGGSDEKRILNDFFLFLGGLKDYSLVSFNGLFFDVPFILRRAELAGLDFSFLKDFPHIDLLPLISGKYCEMVFRTSTSRVSKDEARSWFNIYEPKAPNAKNCILEAAAGNYYPVYLHNSLDLFTTEKLYEKCVALGWV